jgi:ArsR family transcriptional regulator
LQANTKAMNLHPARRVALSDAIKGLSALAQESRLEVFRLLVTASPTGIAAGDIARRLHTPANTLSAQLLILSNAGLITARRDGRSIIYAANFDTVRDLLIFLVQDCCDGHPEICGPLAALLRQSPSGVAVKSLSARGIPRQRRH